MSEMISMLSGVRLGNVRAQLQPQSPYTKATRGGIGEFRCLGCGPAGGGLIRPGLSGITAAPPPPEVEFAIVNLPNEQLYGAIESIRTALKARGLPPPGVGDEGMTKIALLGAAGLAAFFLFGRKR